MISRADFERYLEYRWGKYHEHVRKLRPIQANYACSWLKADLARRVRDRMDPIYYTCDEPILINGATFEIRRYYDDIDNPFDGVIKLVDRYSCDGDDPPSNSGVFKLGSVRRDGYFTLEYDEEQMYEDARKYASKGVARRIAALDRASTVEWARNVVRGDITFTSFCITCKELPDFNEWRGPFEDSQEDEMHAEIEDVLRSALSQISALKDSP